MIVRYGIAGFESVQGYGTVALRKQYGLVV